jgi:poly-gamma-glutamate synthesis protein (capsule biosynthesis protein)
MNNPNINRFILYFILPFLLWNCQTRGEKVMDENREIKGVTIQKDNSPYGMFFGPDIAQGEIGILTAGDVMLDWGIKEVIEKYGSEYPVQKLKPIFQRFQGSICNLETPISDACVTVKNKLYTFQAPISYLGALTFLGINGVMLANNHIGDCQREGMEVTVRNLKKMGIDYGGYGFSGPPPIRKHLHLTIANEKITILSFGIKTLKEDRAQNEKEKGAYFPTDLIITEDIRYWRKRSDYIIVSLHWGTEYTDRPSLSQRKTARKIIELGADAVIGHHSHWVQGIEKYRHGVIIYSLGNFIFGSNNKFLRNGFLAGLIFKNKKLQRVEIFPINTRNQTEHRFQPGPLNKKLGARLLHHVQKLSSEFKTKITVKQNLGFIEINRPEYYSLNHHLRWKMEKRYRHFKLEVN